MRKSIANVLTTGIVSSLAGCFGLSPHTAQAAQPNIILIFVDDQGYYDLGCYGASEVKTPRIDGLAREGTQFTEKSKWTPTFDDRP